MRISVKCVPVIAFVDVTVDVPDGTPAEGLEAAAKEAILKGNWQRQYGQDVDDLLLRAYPEQLPPPEKWELEIPAIRSSNTPDGS